MPGRIAVSSDGNYHDEDDILASAVTVAMLAKTHHANQLVYYGHSDHVWNTSTSREEKMRVSTVETAKMWGGFTLGNFYNAKQQTSQAVSRLASEVNASSATNPLWIIAAGPMEMVGRALAASNSSKHQYVHAISHSSWNENYSDSPGSGESHAGWTWSEMKSSFPNVSYHDIKDQNHGLNEP